MSVLTSCQASPGTLASTQTLHLPICTWQRTSSFASASRWTALRRPLSAPGPLQPCSSAAWQTLPRLQLVRLSDS